MKVYLNGKELTGDYIVLQDTLNIHNRLREQKTCSFNFLKKGRPFPILKKYMPVEVYNNDTLIFKGYILKPKEVRTGIDIQEYNIQCVGTEHLASKRLIAKGYENRDVGYIVNDIWENFLQEEGITIGKIDGGVLIKQESFNYVKATEALKILADRVDYFHFIDDHKRLYFVRKNTFYSPYTISYRNIIGDVEVDRSQDEYRNIQYLTGCKEVTQDITEEIQGDGNTRTFTLKYPIAKEPTVEVKRGNGSFIQQTVGVNGLQDNRQFYWSYNSPTVSQDSEEQILGEDDTFRITYKGLYDIVVKAIDFEEVYKKAEIDGSSGKVEHAEEAKYEGFENALQAGNQMLDRYKKDTVIIRFVTLYEFRVGQLATATFEEKNIINEDFLITKVNMFMRDRTIFYEVEAAQGPGDESWVEFFIKDKEKSKALEGQEKSVVQVIHSYNKVWNEAETPNLFANPLRLPLILPFRLRIPSSTKIKYLAWYGSNGQELGRKQVVTEQISDTEVFTRAVIGANEFSGNIAKFKWIGGNATQEPNTGYVIAKESVNLQKSQLEVFQIERIDTKGW